MAAFEEFRRPQVCVGIALREMRVAKELTQEELSGASGLHATYISDVERGRRNLGWMAFANVVEGLGSTHAEFGAIYDRVYGEETTRAAQLEERRRAQEQRPQS